MANLHLIRSITKEIIDLSAKSAILADKKSNQFCEQYYKLKASNDSTSQASYFQSLCDNHGFKTERLSSQVIFVLSVLLVVKLSLQSLTQRLMV